MKDVDSVQGFVTELLPGGLHRVQITGGKEVLCYLSGKMKINHIRVLVGEEVGVVLDKYGGKATNRIIRRK